MKRIGKIFLLSGIFCAVILIFLFTAGKSYAITVTDPYPNPFCPGYGQKSKISFSVDNSQYVTVMIVNSQTSFNKDTHRYSFKNVYGGWDAVTYAKEIVKSRVARIYAISGKTYTVYWDGTADKGGTFNLCQKGKYYFVVIPENAQQYTVYKPVEISLWNPAWIAYIRQARTWLGTRPYRDDESKGPTVSRDDGEGTNCTGFITSVIWEMGYNPYYGNFPAGSIDELTKSKTVQGGPYMTRVGTETTSNPKNYSLVRQSYILAWRKPQESYEHTTIATYKTSKGWFIIHSSAMNDGVAEELIPSWYLTVFLPPSIYYWNFLGPIY